MQVQSKESSDLTAFKAFFSARSKDRNSDNEENTLEGEKSFPKSEKSTPKPTITLKQLDEDGPELIPKVTKFADAQTPSRRRPSFRMKAQ